MKIILGMRDYEKTASGKYPKYNLQQMNIFVLIDCPSYTGIQIIYNVKCYDMFNKYQDEINTEQKVMLEKEIKKEYGLHNVCIDDLIDWAKFDYSKDKNMFLER